MAHIRLTGVPSIWLVEPLAARPGDFLSPTAGKYRAPLHARGNEVPMLQEDYLVRGLNALSRAHETDYFADGHRGAAIVAAYYLCREVDVEDGVAVRTGPIRLYPAAVRTGGLAAAFGLPLDQRLNVRWL